MEVVIDPEMVAVVSDVFSAASPVISVMGPGNVTLTSIDPRDESPRSAPASSPSPVLCPSLTMRKTMPPSSAVMVHSPVASVNSWSVKLQV